MPDKKKRFDTNQISTGSSSLGFRKIILKNSGFKESLKPVIVFHVISARLWFFPHNIIGTYDKLIT